MCYFVYTRHLNNASITLVSLNLQKGGWTLRMMDEHKIKQYRKRSHVDDAALEVTVHKVAKHGAKVMSWSRNAENCLIM